MSTVVLTTRTPHHIWFLNHIAPLFGVDLVVYERTPASFREDPEETRRFFGDEEPSDEGLNILTTRSVNTQRVQRYVKKMAPDILIVYGTNLVKPNIYNLARYTVNCHGGMVPEFRGLDTNLWAAYYSEYDKIGVTLHALDESYDTGPVWLRAKLDPEPDLSLSTLRYHTTVLTERLVRELIKRLDAATTFSLIPQAQPPGGRFWDKMPEGLRPMADQRLKEWARSYIKEPVTT